MTLSALSRYSPVYWPSWIGFGLLRLCGFLPYHTQLEVGRFLGWLLFHLARGRRHIAEVNIQLCFPELNIYQQKQLVRQNFTHQAIGLMEAGMAWWSVPDEVLNHYKVVGLEHLEEAQAQGNGVLLVSGHYTVLDLAGNLLSRHIDYDGMYRRHNNEVTDSIISAGRSPFFGEMIDRHDMRQMMRRLKEGRIVWYAPDQDFGEKHSVFVPFFGIPAATLTATSRIARLTKSPVLMMAQRRTEDNRYIIEILPAFRDFPSGDDEQDASRFNRTLEQLILAAPAQYMWMHRRFKTHPQGKNYLYKKR